MDASKTRIDLAEVARLGEALLNDQIQPQLDASDRGKFIAIDVETGDFEVHPDDSTAINRLLARHPDAQGWLGCVGEPTTYRLRRGR